MNTMIGKSIDQLRVTDRAELVRQVEQSDVLAFVDATGDENPLHANDIFAARTPFKTPIVPGILTAGFVSAVIGTRLPGPGTTYVSQTLKFLRPVRVGDVITTRVEVLEVLRERNRVRLLTRCVNQHGQEVLTGEAWVMPPLAARWSTEPSPTAELARAA
jgi:3-hydroxybutyryl-CoA dehydratase